MGQKYYVFLDIADSNTDDCPLKMIAVVKYFCYSATLKFSIDASLHTLVV